jgi:hypothetical protein
MLFYITVATKFEVFRKSRRPDILPKRNVICSIMIFK